MSDDLLLTLLSDPAVLADPYPWFRELRETSPVHRAGFTNLWAITRFEDCRSLLCDDRLGVPKAGTQAPALSPVSFSSDVEHQSMAMLNPPDHTRVRSLVTEALDPWVEIVPRVVRQVTAELIDELAAAGGGDLIEALAYPLPGRVLCDLTGVPRSDQDWLRTVAVGIARGLEPGQGLASVQRFGQARGDFRDYVGNLVRQREAEPGDDYVSALIAARDGEARLSRGEIASTVALLYAGGLETTACMVGNMVHTLMQWPDQLARLRADRSLAVPAVLEALRFESPVQIVSRSAFTEVEINGDVIAPDDSVMMMLGAANRDPAAIDDPDRFDITRAESKHLAFGAGIHRCFGALLGRGIGAAVLQELLDRFDVWTPLYDEPSWGARFAIRGLERLPVEFR